MQNKVLLATIDIWKVLTTFKLKVGKKEIVLNKNTFLFLEDFQESYLFFKTEDGVSLKVHESILEKNKIQKVF